ncbi:glutaminase liver isoform, mitochondrial-like isoform X1 [Salvelinus fontinalis]|nr:glutaminase liver isoform, mitochondrial-like isoform X1 [Salvelinus fontinalis]
MLTTRPSLPLFFLPCFFLSPTGLSSYLFPLSSSPPGLSLFLSLPLLLASLSSYLFLSSWPLSLPISSSPPVLSLPISSSPPGLSLFLSLPLLLSSLSSPCLPLSWPLSLPISSSLLASLSSYLFLSSCPLSSYLFLSSWPLSLPISSSPPGLSLFLSLPLSSCPLSSYLFLSSWPLSLPISSSLLASLSSYLFLSPPGLSLFLSLPLSSWPLSLPISSSLLASLSSYLFLSPPGLSLFLSLPLSWPLSLPLLLSSLSSYLFLSSWPLSLPISSSCFPLSSCPLFFSCLPPIFSFPFLPCVSLSPPSSPSRHSVGDTKQPFCLQSCVKPLEYAVAIHEAGTEKVHRYVGMEPSGLKFNKLYLDEEDKPHNPMVNAGAIVISSLIKPGSNKAEKFDYVMDFIKKMAGQEYVGFSNATFQSEKETGDRNFAIGYYLKEKKCFPRGAEMIDALDFYFQLCSIEVTCESGSVMAATLAHGGICPITGERVLSAEAVRNTLSLMHSCGMYDFSGQMAFHVGLPAKSGVSGAVLLVVPNVMGVMCWSPPLDKVGNSVRGIHFCQELVSSFNFHNYDNLRHFVKKQDPRRQDGEDRNKSVVNLMFAAYSGDVSALRRFALSSMDMELKDYDSRTALHVAAAEGHVEVVRFLTDTCKVNPFVKDRWSSIPLDDALQFGHGAVVKVLQEYQVACQEQDRLPVADIIPIPPKLETVEGMV